MSKTIQPHILKQYTLIKLMGSGAYGHVWQVINRKDGKRYALKKVFDAFRNATDAQRTYRQVQFLLKMNHPNIVKLHKAIKSHNKKDFYLIFQIMETDLHSLVGTKVLQKQHMIYIFYQVLLGIKYMHSGQLIHRDLKPSNVLINQECLIKLCDLGLVRSLKQKQDKQDQQQIMSQQVATKWYRAPQLLLSSNSYGKPVDLWSAGCIFAQLILGKPLFTGDSTLNQLQRIIQFTGPLTKQDIKSLKSPVIQTMLLQINIKNNSMKQKLKKIDRDFHQLIVGLIKLNPNKRLTVDEALSIPLFYQFKDQKVLLMNSVPISQIDDNIKYDVNIYRNKLFQIAQKMQNKQQQTIKSLKKEFQQNNNNKKQKSEHKQSQKLKDNKFFSQFLKKSRNKSLSKQIKNYNVSHGSQKFVNTKQNILKSYSNSLGKFKKSSSTLSNQNTSKNNQSLSNSLKPNLKQNVIKNTFSVSKFNKYQQNCLKNKKNQKQNYQSIYFQRVKIQRPSYLFKKTAKKNMFNQFMNINNKDSTKPQSVECQRRISYKFIN